MISFTIGSSAFFSGYKDYTNSVYENVLILDDNPDYEYETNYLENNKHIVRWRNMSKNEFIDFHKGLYKGRYIGKFLVPEFAEYLGMTIEDLQQLSHLIEYLDEKHLYEKIIYDSYISNNDFYLTDTQRYTAYLEYKKERGLS